MADDISGTNNDVKKKDDGDQDSKPSASESRDAGGPGSSSETSEKSTSGLADKASQAGHPAEQTNSDSVLQDPKNGSDVAWYRESRTLGLGDVNRYIIKYTVPNNSTLEGFFFRLKNMEKTGLRAIHLVNGPFILYCHIVPWNYHSDQRFEPSNSSVNNEVCFKNTIKPGQTFNVKLEMNRNSLVQEDNDGTRTYGWHCDVISQIVLNRKASISYTVMIGDDLQAMRRVNRSALTALSKGDFSQVFEVEQPKPHEIKENSTHEVQEQKHDTSPSNLNVVCKITDEIWTRKPQFPNKPIHLVIITHGIFSNLTADMLFLRDSIMTINSSGQNFVVDGFRGNAGRTEKGIRRLGTGVAEYTVKLIEKLENDGCKIRDISFVGHSLGGPVQLYALKHILETEKVDFFQRKDINLKHFVCMASPMLGILSEMSLIISWFLDLGTLGKTGRDLTLSKKLPSVRRDRQKKGPHWGLQSSRPVLETLPDEPVATLLKSFHSRTVYANAVNDGIVPLRTSALLYLDWEALGDIRGLRNESGGKAEENVSDAESLSATAEKEYEQNSKGNDNTETENGGDQNGQDENGESRIGQVPEESNVNVAEKYTTFLARIFNLDFDNSTKKHPPHKRKKIRNRIKRYAKINVKSSDLHTTNTNDDAHPEEDSAADGEPGEVSGDEEGDSGSFNIPPKASAVESALNSVICPTPSRRYINEPETRSSVIFHDKYYHFKHVPEESPKTGNFNKFFHYHDWRMDKQVKIAAKYHGPKLSWRKVLVKLPPDAHNNIVVRRRFANGYGWGVVDHLKNEVFTEELRAKF